MSDLSGYVLVLGRMLQEHNRNIGQVLERIRGAGLKLKPKKCLFAQCSVEYLGHIVYEHVDVALREDGQVGDGPSGARLGHRPSIWEEEC